MNPPAAAIAAPLTVYPARIERVIDGDTVVARLDLGLGVTLLQPLQLAGVDAPERSTEAGQQTLAYVQERLLHQAVLVAVQPQRARDSFGRLLATIGLDGGNFNQELIDQGHAVAYGSGKK